jgi:acyl carrier protein
MRDRLEKIFRESFGVSRLDDAMSIDNVEGWDSMAHVGLILALQKEFNVSVSPVDAIELTTVKEIVQYLTARGIQ